MTTILKPPSIGPGSPASAPVSLSSSPPYAPDPSPAQFSRWLADAIDHLKEIASPMRLWDAVRAGRATSPQRRRVVGRLMDAGRARLSDISRAFADRLPQGLDTLAGWARRFADAVAPQHYAAVMAALSSVDLKPADRAATDDRVAEQIKWLAKFRDDIRTGRQPIWTTDPVTGARTVGGRLLARSEMYSDSSWSVVEGVVRAGMIRDGYTYERRVLGGENHCEFCPALARMGWKPTGELPGIGQGTPCKNRCRCTMEWSHSDLNAIAASPLGGRPA